MLVRKLFSLFIMVLSPAIWLGMAPPTAAAGVSDLELSLTLPPDPLAPQAVETVTTTVVITASKDTFIIDSLPDNNAGGEGAVTAGRTDQPDTRRGLIAFDVSSNVPAGATILTTSLTLDVIQTPTGPANSGFGLHLINTDWTEGTKTGASGAAATTGEATWNAAMHSFTPWTSSGGDFNPTASVTTPVTTVGSYTWDSTSQMVADVQSWLDSPATNYGWLLKSDDEVTAKTARRFGSIEGDNPATLSVSYTYTPLPIPDQLMGTLSNGWRVYNLTMMTGTTVFTGGLNTPTMGYNGTYLGPVLVLTRTENITINVTNDLTESTTTHWHGLHVPAAMDGGPHQEILSGSTWSAYFTVDNPASTNWFHPHMHGTTGRQVYNGLAGLIYVNDTASSALAIPKTYGVDDIPLIIQDREFNPDGSFKHNDPRQGSNFLINGAIDPTLSTHAQMIRFRILNGSNARIYNFGFSDNRTFQQIASDSGFLVSPVDLTRVVLAPGERAEIVVDFSGEAGTSLQLMAYNSEVAYNNHDMFDNIDFNLFNISVGDATTDPVPVTTLPTTLNTITRFTAAEAVNQASPRTFVLSGHDKINGLSMDMTRIDQVVTLGDIEIWQVTVDSGGHHPFHVHDGSFQILSRDGVDPPANEQGWKDTVLVSPGEVVQIIKKFEDYSNPDLPFMFHCHLLEHEDAGMMGQFTIVEDFLTPDNTGTASPGQTVYYTHVLSNPSSINSDTFTITTSSSQGWTVAVEPSSATITLAAGATQVVTLAVTVPSTATVGTVDTTVLTAASTNVPLMLQTATNSTTIGYLRYLPMILKNDS